MLAYSLDLGPQEGEGGVLRISRDARMIEGFWGFKIVNSGIFLGRKIWQVFFWRWLDLSRDFLGGIQYNLKIRGTPRVCPREVQEISLSAGLSSARLSCSPTQCAQYPAIPWNFVERQPLIQCFTRGSQWGIPPVSKQLQKSLSVSKK